MWFVGIRFAAYRAPSFLANANLRGRETFLPHHSALRALFYFAFKMRRCVAWVCQASDSTHRSPGSEARASRRRRCCLHHGRTPACPGRFAPGPARGDPGADRDRARGWTGHGSETAGGFPPAIRNFRLGRYNRGVVLSRNNAVAVRRARGSQPSRLSGQTGEQAVRRTRDGGRGTD